MPDNAHVLAPISALQMHRIDAERMAAMRSYAEMYALAVMFLDWALNDPNIDPERRTGVMLRAVDFERLADHCGPHWRPADSADGKDVIQFIARAQLDHMLGRS